MSTRIEERLKELGLELPKASAPGANYIPYVRSGNLVYVSGQVCSGMASAGSSVNSAANLRWSKAGGRPGLRAEVIAQVLAAIEAISAALYAV